MRSLVIPCCDHDCPGPAVVEGGTGWWRTRCLRSLSGGGDLLGSRRDALRFWYDCTDNELGVVIVWDEKTATQN